MTDNKIAFLVAYDYGMGGLWGIMTARSEDEIMDKYPELGIAHDRPAWMTESIFEQLNRDELHDIDEEPWGILKALLTDRGK
jgi:hypothetical protein